MLQWLKWTINQLHPQTFFSYLTIIMCSFWVSLPVYAGWQVGFSSGQGSAQIVPYRFNLTWSFGPFWPRDSNWQFHALWENSAAYWNGQASRTLAGSNDDLYAFTSGPLFRWQRASPDRSSIVPFFELGVGASWLSKREIGGRRLSLHFQFEDKIGLGIRFGARQQYEVAYRLYHYSNASIKRPNTGVNIQMFSVSYWF